MSSPSERRSWRSVIRRILLWPGPSNSPPLNLRQRWIRTAGWAVALFGFWLWLSAAFVGDVSPGYVYRESALRSAAWLSGFGAVLGVAGILLASTTGGRRWLWFLVAGGAAGIGFWQTADFVTSA